MSVAVLTGGGRGLGRGIARALAHDGFDLVIGWRSDREAVDSCAEEVRAGGRSVITVQGDVALAETSKLLLDAALDLGGPDAWINNAGVSVLAPVIDTTADELTQMIDVNLVGTFHGMQAAALWFLDQRRGGRIVNIASEAGVQAFRLLGGYAATKFAVVGLTQAAALELSPSGITVNAVCPGTAETDMVLAERASEVRLTGFGPNEVRDAYLGAIPAGRFCTPDDVGALVAWLCSPGASYVTGQSLCVNGGSVLR